MADVKLELGEQDDMKTALVSAETALAKAAKIKTIGIDQIKKADAIREKYKKAKSTLDQRIVDNEKWYRLRHWEVVNSGKTVKNNDPLPASAWLLNSLANKHADAMDNYPNPVVLPREKSDEPDAKLLTGILPVLLEENQYEQVYSDVFWYKLKSGTGVTGVFWDKSKQNGLGDVAIKKIDLLNLFWEPMITDIQDSRHLFHVTLADKETMLDAYPELKDASTGTNDALIGKYTLDEEQDTSDKLPVVDWYYKKRLADGRTLLHYCKYCQGVVLYATENDPQYVDRGWYDHGLYPFVFDPLFPLESMPVGFGYVDVSKSPQIYIDKLDQVMLAHGYRSTRQRFLVKEDGVVNEEEFADWDKDFVHIRGTGDLNDSVVPIQLPPMTADVINLRTQKIDELKETGGNRDFSQGSTSSGVTAASAIAALQEAGSKLSRDMIKSSYRSFQQVSILTLELIRQFYNEQRSFRIVGEDGARQYVAYSGQRIAAQQQGDGFNPDAYRKPIFDIKVVAQKQSPFSTVAQNERAKELYGLAFFRPDNADQALAALSMMQFEGIESVRERITQNGTLFQKLQQLTPLVLAMSQELDALKGTQYTPQIAQILGMQLEQGTPIQTTQNDTQANTLGDTFNESKGSTVGEARKRAAQNSTPKA